MTCRICRAKKRYYWRGIKIREAIRRICESEKEYIKLSKLVWSYEFGAQEKPLSSSTIYRHKVGCLGLPSANPNPHGRTRGIVCMTKKQKQQIQKRMLEELKALQS